MMCSAQTGCEQHSLSEQSVMPSKKQMYCQYVEMDIVEKYNNDRRQKENPTVSIQYTHPLQRKC